MIDHYGYFNRAKVFWAGPKQYPVDLTQLAHNCANSSVACGCSDHNGSFTPHVSLLRKVSGKPELQNFEPFEWTVHSFCLMESESNQAGVQYRVIREFPMQEI
jgi:2'-5' RNA ligase